MGGMARRYGIQLDRSGSLISAHNRADSCVTQTKCLHFVQKSTSERNSLSISSYYPYSVTFNIFSSTIRPNWDEFELLLLLVLPMGSLMLGDRI